MIELPIDLKIDEVLKILHENNNLVLTAAPGAGKTTRIPPALIKLTSKQVWVLEPRRMAAVAAAQRIAEEQGWQIGDQIGYSVRFDSRSSSKNKVLFLTEAMLARKLMTDPEINDCGIIVLDEFHERSIHVDLALGLIKELQMLARPDLKIVVMSATLELKLLQTYLDNSQCLSVAGRLFEIEKCYQKQNQLMRTDSLFIERVVQSIKDHLIQSPNGKDVLVFLPGMSEIHRTQRFISEQSWGLNYEVLPLSGSLALEDQLKALKPMNRRKIILSTNVAESSVTVDGIDTVIDSGLVREIELNPKTGFERLELRRISKASAEQRAGRAGRQYKGKCIKLWAKVDELSMPDFESAEIHRRDLTELILILFKLGISQPIEFSWFEAPEKNKIDAATKFLMNIGAIQNGRLTEMGHDISEIPLHPRLAKLLIEAAQQNQLVMGAQLCALLQEKDILKSSSGQHDSQCDLTERWELLELCSKSRGHKMSHDLNVAATRTVLQASEHLVQSLKGKFSPSTASSKPDIISDLLLGAYSDRLCRRRKKENLSALMVGGRGVILDESSSAKFSEFFLALEISDSGDKADSHVRKACGISKDVIEKKFRNQITKSRKLTFDEELKSYFFEEWNDLQGLPLEEPRRRPAKADEIIDLLPQIMLERWQDVLKINQDLKLWLERWTYFESKFYPKASTINSDCIKMVLEQACLGETKFEITAEKNLVYFFESVIGQELISELEANCPSDFVAPTGSRIKIHYHSDKNPHIEIRLQEVFGTLQTPTVCGGQVPITIHLLAPNYRPVQVTADLASFWKNIYPEVKRELRTRYPKHSWPEDPTTAAAQAKGRPTKNK